MFKEPSGVDNAQYLAHSIRLYQTLNMEGVVSFGKLFFFGGPSKAPLVMIMPLPFYYLLGTDMITAQLVHVICFILIAFLLFRIGQLNGTNVGFFSVIIFSVIPWVFFHARIFLTELPLTLFVVWTIYLLLQPLRPKLEILLGIAIGLGLMTKVSYPVFVAGPFILWIFNRWSQDGYAKTIWSLAKIGAIAFLIFGPWYILNFKRLIDYSWYAITYEPGSMGPIFSIKTILYFWKRLFWDHFGVYLSVLLIIAIIGWLQMRKNGAEGDEQRKKLYVIIGGLLVSLIVATFRPNKQPSHLIPMYPYIAVIVAFGLNWVIHMPKWGKIIRIVVWTLIFIHFAVLMRVNFALWPEGPDYRPFKVEIFPKKTFTSGLSLWTPSLNLGLVTGFLKDFKNERSDAKILVVELDDRFNASLFDYYGARYGLGFKFSQLAFLPTINEFSLKELKKFDFILTIDGLHLVWPQPSTVQKVKVWLTDKTLFHLVSSVPLRRGGERVLIYSPKEKGRFEYLRL